MSNYFIRDVVGIGHQVISKITGKVIGTFDDQDEAEDCMDELNEEEEDE